MAPEEKLLARFRPQDCLVGVIRRLADERVDAIVRLPGVADVAVLGTRAVFGADSRVPDGFWTAPASTYQVAPIGRAAVTSPGGWRPLDEALWTAGFHASGGRLMEGCQESDIVRLNHWPNGTRLPVTPGFMQLCALFMRRPTTVSLAQRLLKVDAAEIHRFYSAATCAGVVTVLNRRAEAVAVAPMNEQETARPQPRKQRLFDLLFAKLLGN